jgi:16S rRNA processing protein RimM
VVGDEVHNWPADAVEVGRVVGAWGIKGAIKVQPFSAAPEALFSSKRWYLAAPDAPRTSPLKQAHQFQWPRLLRIAQARTQGDAIVATVHELTDRDLAQSLAGARVHVPRASFPSTGDDEFYWVDLIGLPVLNRAGVDLGVVQSLQETGPHCVLRLSSSDAQGQPRMIPFVAAYVDEVSLAQRCIRVDWPADY